MWSVAVIEFVLPPFTSLLKPALRHPCLMAANRPGHLAKLFKASRRYGDELATVNHTDRTRSYELDSLCDSISPQQSLAICRTS